MAGVATGKTYFALLKVWKYCLEFPQSLALVVRKEYTDLRDSTLKDFQRYFDVTVDMNKEYHFQNGSCIMFRHGAEMEVLKNLNLSIFMIEQAEEFENEEAFTFLRDRLRRENASYRQGIIIANTNGHNWIWRMWKNNKSSDDFDLYEATTFDNEEHLPKDFIEDLKRMERESPNHYQRYVMNSWEEVDAADLLLPYHIIEAATQKSFFPEGQKILSCDVARFGDDETVINILQKANGGWKEIYLQGFKGQDTTQTVGRIIDLRRESRTNYHVIDDIGVGCLTKETEVWTTKGWKPVESITNKDKVYSKDKSNNLIESRVISNTKREMTRILSNGQYSFSFSHFLPCKTRREYPFKNKSWDWIISRDSIWLDNKFNWNGKDLDIVLDEQYITMPYGGTKKIRTSQRFNTKTFAPFLAWFISEGSSDSRGITISQSVKSRHHKSIIEALNSCGLKYKKKTHNGENEYRIFNKPLKEWLYKNCYHSEEKSALTKCIPTIIKNSTTETIRIFLDEFIKGDGFIHKGQNTYCTSSAVLADDLLELIYKSGKYGGKRIHQEEGSVGYIHGRKITRTAHQYRVWENKNGAFTIYPKDLKESLDNVYDLKVNSPTRFFMVRFRDNRAFWVHNGGVTDMLREAQLPNIRPFIANEKVLAPEFASKRDECYWKLKELFERGQIQIINNEKLKTQLSSIRFEYRSNGQKKIISKDDMKSQGLSSPDYADALMMSMSVLFQANASKTHIEDTFISHYRR